MALPKYAWTFSIRKRADETLLQIENRLGPTDYADHLHLHRVSDASKILDKEVLLKEITLNITKIFRAYILRCIT